MADWFSQLVREAGKITIFNDDVGAMSNHKEEPVTYTFEVNQVGLFMLLIVGCLLLFVLILLSIFPLLSAGLIKVPGMVIVSVLALVLPGVLFVVVRKRLRSEVTVNLSPRTMEIHWPKRQVVLEAGSIRSRWSHFSDMEDMSNSVQVVLNLADGRKIRLRASTFVGKIDELKRFRKDFDEWAEREGIEEKPPWWM